MLVAAALVLVGGSAFGDITRHCDAKIHWQTTGGSLSGSFAKKMASHLPDRPFSAPGTCGSNHGNRCRQRARDTMTKCLDAHRAALAGRGLNNPPPIPQACHSTKHYDYSWGPIASNDVLKRIAAEVCCRYAGGTYRFSNPRDVRVNVWAEISGGNRHCARTVRLAENLGVNCSRARDACPDIKE
jgi:hypothetical protein